MLTPLVVDLELVDTGLGLFHGAVVLGCEHHDCGEVVGDCDACDLCITHVLDDTHDGLTFGLVEHSTLLVV